MSFSGVARRAAIALVLVVPAAAVAQSSSGPGDFAPPKTKKQCLRILKADRAEWAAERKSYPARKQAAQDKVSARRTHLAALVAQRRSINQQIEAIMNTSTEGLTQEQVDAMNAQIDALTEQKRTLQDKIDVAGGKVDEAVLARKAVVAKFLDDKKNFPVYIAQVAAYCAKM